MSPSARRRSVARVTVEDCIEKIEQPLRSRPHGRAPRPHHFRRRRRSPSTATTTRTRSSPCARSATAPSRPEDLREDLIHSLQKYVEVDEPERHAAPLLDANADEDGDTFDTI